MGKNEWINEKKRLSFRHKVTKKILISIIYILVLFSSKDSPNEPVVSKVSLPLNVYVYVYNMKYLFIGENSASLGLWLDKNGTGERWLDVVMKTCFWWCVCDGSKIINPLNEILNVFKVKLSRLTSRFCKKKIEKARGFERVYHFTTEAFLPSDCHHTLTSLI